MLLRNRHILLGITGGIAAYKIPLLVRLLKLEGAEVRVICTSNALQFVTEKTLSVLTESPVLTDFFDAETGEWNHHVNLGLWADLMVIAPCGSNTMGKIVHGLCDNLLTTTIMSARCPVWIAPAMDLDMYQEASVQENLDWLTSNNYKVLDSAKGPLASGLSGKGRMQEPEDIFSQILEHFNPSDTQWHKKKVIITAGPTHEPIDPVRFVGNRSTGLMGISIAERLWELGADVELILGPTHLRTQYPLPVHRVETAQNMFDKCMELHEQADVIIMAAAVADYRPADVAEEKIKKNSRQDFEISWIENPDIVKSLSEIKLDKQKIIGFALETNNAKENAISKLKNKNLDCIILNSPSPNTGFASTTNKVNMFNKNGDEFESNLESKQEIANIIVNKLHDWIF